MFHVFIQCWQLIRKRAESKKTEEADMGSGSSREKGRKKKNDIKKMEKIRLRVGWLGCIPILQATDLSNIKGDKVKD